MKKLFFILLIFYCMGNVYPQAPEKMNYQAVIRDSANHLLINTAVGMQFSILQGSESGTLVFKERHSLMTNQNGLIQVEIGTGSVLYGDFSAIDWANGPYYIKTESDPKGGADYTLSGSSQLSSVPYALYAKTAEQITEKDPLFAASLAAGISATDTSTWNKKLSSFTEKDPVYEASPAFGITFGYIDSWNNKQNKLTAGSGIDITNNVISTTTDPAHFYLGQDTLDGIVYYIYTDKLGKQHGLIVSKTETTTSWQYTPSLTNANRSDDGAYNTNLMTISLAKNWITGNFSSLWYLPSIDEVSLLWHSRFHVNKTLRQGGHTQLSLDSYYWSSTESNYNNAYFFFFLDGYAGIDAKNSTFNVRAVRAF